MKLSITNICRIFAISLLVGVIWQGTALAAVFPAFEPLGRLGGGLRHPSVVDVDASGNVYVVDSIKGTVFKFDKYGQQVAGFVDSGFTGRGLAVTPDGKRIYVSRADSVAIVDGVSGAVVGSLGAGAGEFRLAGEIDLDAAGFIFVADNGTKFIRVYDTGGQFQYQFAGQGFGAGQLYGLAAMSVNEAAGEVYVADPAILEGYSVPKVQVYDVAGNFLRTLSAATGFGSPGVIRFGGMAFDNAGRGYFLDKFRGELKVMGMPTQVLGSFGSTGAGPGQTVLPSDLAFDPVTSRLFVLSDDARIEVFGIDGGKNPVSANEVPGVPTLVSPIADSEVASATPRLEFENAVDADDDVLTYDARLYLGELVVDEYLGQPESEGLSYIQTSTELQENARYEWEVRAFDGRDPSDWSPRESFYVNAVEEPPLVPVLDGPLAGEVLDGAGVLSWQESSDPDPYDALSYVVEIAADEAFASLVATEEVGGVSLPLGSLQQYADLVDGQAYFWRVLAKDDKGLLSEPSEPGSFAYDTTILKVTANIPGAKVYLGGNLGYAGRYVGEAPVELRDVRPGVTSVVVERSGLEPLVLQVAPIQKENVELYAALVPAFVPADHKARPFVAGGAELVLETGVTPFLVDFDNDDIVDLLVGDAAGGLSLAKGEMVAEELVYAAPVAVELSSVVAGLSPFVVDWDNDGRKDILAGGADGSVVLFANTGTETTPAFGGATALFAGSEVLSVAGPAVPAVLDVDDDGDKDLFVGTGEGEMIFFRNDGEDASPVLTRVGNAFEMPSGVGTAAGGLAPFFADWDSDGQRELLAATNQHLFVCEKSAGNVFVAQSVLSVTDELATTSGGGKKNGNGSYALGENLRVFVIDLDVKKGKDMVIGNAAGQVRFVLSSNGKGYVATFVSALLDKVSQIGVIAEESASDMAADLNALAAAIEAGDLKSADKLATDMQGRVAPGTELASAIGQLIELLP